MGRPLNKRNFGPGGWGITAYRRVGESLVDGSSLAIDGIWIKRQASTRDFIITNGVWEERMTMDLAENAASLNEGRFVIAAYDPEGVQVGVTKIAAHKWAYLPNRAIETIGGSWQGPTELVQIADIDDQQPTGITTVDPHGFETGDEVNLYGLAGTDYDFLEALGSNITVTGPNTFTIVGGDTEGLPAYTGNAGVAVRIFPVGTQGYIASGS